MGVFWGNTLVIRKKFVSLQHNLKQNQMVRTLLVVLCSLCFCPVWTQSMQHGKASYYSKTWTGRMTANGERLHHDSMTCAHRYYPFGTLLRVTNLNNGKRVDVRVTDRGPYRRGRIIDLSWGAAKAIGMIASGIATVTVERLYEPTVPFKLEEDTLPRLEIEMADILPRGITPFWQQDSIKRQRIQKRVSVRPF